MPNHWDDNGDLVIEERTLFRQVGWQGHKGGQFYFSPPGKDEEPGGYSPMYVQIAVDHGEGWVD